MIFFLLSLILSLSCGATERITKFVSDLYVEESGLIRVVENITVEAENDQIKRGIVREFPTRYTTKFGNHFVVTFDLQNVLRDGKPAQFDQHWQDNGVRVYIRNKNVIIPPGEYTFTLEYTVNRSLGFFENHDEIYWNVTGNGWRLPIDKVIARIHLPPEIPKQKVEVAAFTGAFQQRGKAYMVKTLSDGVIEFETSRPFKTFEGISVVVGWPKGFIAYPSLWQQWRWFFEDNIAILLLLLGLLILFVLYLSVYLKNRKDKAGLVTIPLYHPPKGMTPGQMRYMIKMKYDQQVLASDIVNMAVHGWLEIKCTQAYFSQKYSLVAKKKPDDSWYAKIYHLFFDNDQGTIDLSRSNRAELATVLDLVQKRYSKECKLFFKKNNVVVGFGLFFSFVWSLLLFAVDAEWFFLAGLLLFMFNGIGHTLLQTYSKKGWKIRNEIDGFKMFLQATESERLKLVGTPPTKTPQLYEKYLPYAIALGVEKAWSVQFAPVFRKLEQEGTPYTPIWIYGGRFNSFNTHSFSSNMASSLSSAISSASTPPGSSSGFGGGGFGGGSSGGGSGGGGGGGC